MEKEIWKPLAGYEDSHEASNLGRIRSIDRVINSGSRWGRRPEKRKGRVLWQLTNPDGYQCVRIKKNSKVKEYRVHRLVALTFLGAPLDDSMEVNHKDGNKKNNRVDNLEWVTHRENCIYNFTVLKHDRTGMIGRAGVRVVRLDTGEVFPSATAAARSIGGTQGGMWHALHDGNGVYYGKPFAYKYIEEGE